MRDRIDVEKELTACLRPLGATVSDDTKSPNKPTNADYCFPADKVVAELKCMSDDYFADGTFMDWLNRAYQSWVIKGLAPRFHTKSAKVNLANLDPQCYRDVLSFVKKRVERSFKSASKQIQATKINQGMRDATGLLLLVNDGNYGVVPSMFESITARTLPKFSGINTVIYFSVNMPMNLTDVDMDVLPWCVWSKASIRPPVPSDFLDRIKDAWNTHHESLIGKTISLITGTSDALLGMEYIKR